MGPPPSSEPPPGQPPGRRPPPRPPLRSRVAALAGAGVATLSRAARRGSGAVIGGHAILAIDPDALAHFAAGREVTLVSGTNGKTTTTKLLVTALAATTGGEVVTNLTGANLPTGLATALAGGPPAAPAVLEVDEAWLARVAGKVGPAAVVLLNLSRDQLDRNNEVRHVARRWRQACLGLPPTAAVVANADDPLVAWAASGAPRVTWVGAGLGWRQDAAGCPECAGPVIFPPDGNDWHCQDCGFSRPRPDVALEAGGDGGAGRAVWSSGETRPLHLGLPGRCNQGNAVTALAALKALGHPLDDALAALAEVRDVAGRYATLTAPAGARARLLLAKNPAGWAEVFDMLAPPPGPVVIAINARTADGHDPSWLWDVPFERLAAGGPRPVVATGERYLDLGVRLHYAGISHTMGPDLVHAVDGAGEGAKAKVDVVANYTAFHQLLGKLRA